MKWGAIQGLGIGLVFTAWVTFLRIVRGTKPFEVNHTTFAAVLALYLVGGPFAGAIVGLFRPISKRLPGAILAGAVGGIPAGIAVRLALFGFTPISEDDLWFLAAFSLWAGPLAGYVFWRNSRREDRHLRSQRRQ
jgi:hypothetical protein